MTYDLLFALAAFAFVSSITPGPNNLMLVTSAVNFGFARTLPHMLGVGIGFTAMVGLVGLGLSGVFNAIPHSHDALKIISSVYMLYLAWKIATASGFGEKSVGAKPMTFMQAVLFQWVNPKGWTMALTATAVYAASGSLAAVGLVTLVFGLINMPSIAIWVVAGDRLKHFLTNPARLRAFNIVMALLLVASLYPVLRG